MRESTRIDIQPTNGLKDTIERRRAVRAFRTDPIPRVLLEEILRLGLRSPSGFNLQPWRFIVVQAAAAKQTLQECAFGQAQVTQAPLVLICCGDRTVGQDPDYIEEIIQLGLTHDAIDADYAESLRTRIPKLFQDQPSFQSLEAWTNRQTMLAVAHLMIVAKGFGVDSCPMEGFATEKVKAAFNIPETVDVCCLLCLGYEMEKQPKRFGGRFDYTQVCYQDRYGEPFSLP